MNKQIKIARVVLLFLSIIAVISLVNHISDSIFSIRYITYNFDDRLSARASMVIKNYVENCQLAGIYNVKAIMQELPARCASVKSVSLLKTPPHTAELSITLFDPIVAINDDKILIENNNVINAAYYADYVKSSLYAMTITDKVPASFGPELATSIAQAVQEKLFDHYTFNIASEHEWYLHDKQDPAFTVCCNAASVPMGLVQEKYAQLKKLIRKKELTKTAWIADVRFKDQIVLSMSIGGHYGK
jgi:hypothetical protein